MTNNKKAVPNATPKSNHINDTSTSAQRALLLERLRLNSVDTFTARRDLNLMMPAARIKELRDAGHNIKTQRITETDLHGQRHDGVALYYLSKSEA